MRVVPRIVPPRERIPEIARAHHEKLDGTPIVDVKPVLSAETSER